MNNMAWLDGYSGQSTEELLCLEGKYRTDSIILAFEQALQQKAELRGKDSLSSEENVILAVEALEREVNNGGYGQFFINSSKEYAHFIVSALERIGCNEVARLTQQAIQALGLKQVTIDSIDTEMQSTNEQRDEKLGEYDKQYYSVAGDLAGPLLSFIKENKERIEVK